MKLKFILLFLVILSVFVSADELSDYCIGSGYDFEASGSDPAAMNFNCIFPDGTMCDAQEFFDGDCGNDWTPLYIPGNCFDSDGGKNYYIQARINLDELGGSDGTNGGDTCLSYPNGIDQGGVLGTTGTHLLEWFCCGGICSNNEIIECDCENGACEGGLISLDASKGCCKINNNCWFTSEDNCNVLNGNFKSSTCSTSDLCQRVYPCYEGDMTYCNVTMGNYVCHGFMECTDKHRWSVCQTACTDSDSDGDPDITDCVDSDASIYSGKFPGNPSDGVDDDCNGVIDDEEVMPAPAQNVALGILVISIFLIIALIVLYKITRKKSIRRRRIKRMIKKEKKAAKKKKRK